MSWKKTFVRHLLPLVSLCALMPFGTGCIFTDIENVGTTDTEFSEYRYEMSPGRDEIILTATRTKRFYYLPLYDFPAWTSVRTVEERIPLNPLPEHFSRCGMIVEVDPDAPPAKVEPLRPLPPGYYDKSEEERSDPSKVQYEFKAYVDELPLQAGETFHLQVRPDDLKYLDQPFRVRIIRKGGRPDVLPPDLEAYLQKRHLSENEEYIDYLYAEGEEYLMFPCAVNGCRYELLSDLRRFPGWGWGEHDTQPFGEEWDRERENEYYRPPWLGLGGGEPRGKPTFGAICLKVVCFPMALVEDTLLLPVYIPLGAVMLFNYAFF